MYEVILHNGDRAEAETKHDAAIAMLVLVREAKKTTRYPYQRHVIVTKDGQHFVGPTPARYAYAKLMGVSEDEARAVTS